MIQFIEDTPFNGMKNLPVSVLFARADSVYKSLPGCDVWDQERDALLYSGNNPVVCHPPCRSWGRLSAFSKHSVEEQGFALHAVGVVHRCGGVLEHPAHSKLWKAAQLPRPGKRDKFGGWTLPVLQSWWGHRAFKSTWLYIVGIDPFNIPTIPYSLDLVPSSVENMGQREREATPPLFAEWLVDLAGRCSI